MKRLERSLSLTAAIAISIGGMLGSGIFVLPGLAAAKSGSSVWLAYLIAAICIIPAALSKSELATAMPSTGGTYVYIERAFGPLMGTISGIGLWLSLLLKSAFALVGFGAYMSVFFDIDADIIKYSALFFLGLIMLLNIFGIKKVGKVQIIIVSLSLTTLVLLLIFGIPSVSKENLNPFLSDGNYGLIATVAFVYISYAGVTKVSAIAGEIKNPSKNLPRAMIFSLLIMTVIFVSVAFVLVGNIPMETLATDLKPIFTLAEILGGKQIGITVAVIGVITLVSMANSGVLASSRFPFAMAKDDLLPHFMSRIHFKHLTPYITIIITCVTMAFVIVFLDVVKIAKLASAFKVLIFILVNLCVIVLRETSAQWYNPPYRSPLYPYVQLFGIASGLILLIFLGMIPLLVIVGIIILGTLIYIRYGKNATRTGVIKKYGHRPALFLLYNKRTKKRVLKSKSNQFENSNFDGKFLEDSGVVIPLLGNETSPEMLVEIAAAINKKEKIQAINLTEVPNQTFLDAFDDTNPKIKSIERRISRLAKSNNINVDFEAAVTHDLSKTIHDLSDQLHCDWLVMGWNGRLHNGILVSNPIGWLVTHINSDFALFKDNGVRHIGKVLIALRPGGKHKNIIAVADRISQFYKADLTMLQVLPVNTNDEILENIKIEVQEKLAKTISKTEFIIQKNDDSIGTISKISAGYDLLIVGTPQRNNWIKVLFGTGKDRFAEKSACSVLRLTIKENE